VDFGALSQLHQSLDIDCWLGALCVPFQRPECDNSAEAILAIRGIEFPSHKGNFSVEELTLVVSEACESFQRVHEMQALVEPGDTESGTLDYLVLLLRRDRKPMLKVTLDSKVRLVIKPHRTQIEIWSRI